MKQDKLIKIAGSGLLGAWVGSTMGIAAMGTAIAGTLPIGILAALVTYLWTKDKDSKGMTLDECRECIVQNIGAIQTLTKDKAEELNDNNSTWFALFFDASFCLFAIRQRPESIPVIVLALMRVVFALDSLSKGSDRELLVALSSFLKALTERTAQASARLIELHGHKITDSEQEEVEAFFDRIHWDAVKMKFVLNDA